MDINKVLCIDNILYVKYFISAGEEVNLRTHNIREQWLEKLEENILKDNKWDLRANSVDDESLFLL